MNGDDKRSGLFKHPNDIKKQDINTLLLGENASLSDQLYLQSIINLTQSDEDKLLEFIVNYNKYQKKSKQGKQEQNNIMHNFVKLSKERKVNQDDKLASIGKEFKNLSQQNNNNLLNIDDDYNNQEKDIDMSNDKTNKSHDLIDDQDDDLWWLDEDKELIVDTVHDEFMNDNDNDDEEDNEDLDSEEALEEELESEEQYKELGQEINDLKQSDEEDEAIEEPEEYTTESEEDSEEEFDNADSLDKDADYLNSSKAVYDDYIDTDAKDDEDLWALNDQQISSNIFNEHARILPKSKIPNFLSIYNKNRLVNTKVHITVEAGRLDLTLERLLTMQVGDIFEFAGLPAKVKLMANGSLLANGYLVEINGRIGVKIANLNTYNGNDDDTN